VVADDPVSAVAHYDLGGALRRMGRSDESIEELERAASLAPGDFDTAVELGLACAAAGRKDEAIRELRRAIALRPEAPESTMHLPQVIHDLESGVSPKLD
jgi:Flp pilus assembly protein TadD